jgi:hypothetical protein
MFKLNRERASSRRGGGREEWDSLKQRFKGKTKGLE